MPRAIWPVMLILSMIWGGSYYFIKVLLGDFGPWTIVFLRCALGLVVIAIYMLAARQPLRFKQAPWGAVAVMALVNTCIPWAIIGFSETRIASSMASVLNATTPLWSLLLGIAFFGAAARRLQWLGMGVAMIGLAVLVGLDSSSVQASDARGFAGMIAASVFYGLGSQLSNRLLRTMSTYQVTFGTLFFSMLGSGVMAFSSEKIPYSQLLVPSNLFVLAGLGILGSGVAYLLFYWIVHEGGPTRATMVTYLLPVFSLVWGFALLGESIHWSMIAGLALILAGVFLAGRKKAASRQPKSFSLPDDGRAASSSEAAT
ncbi:DMT family transporter [Cohnella lubricantis]|uniref:DMT family transporter n=1 Tax=Cohnella lubricantis TaxID=2163172 RepID=A0A841TC97_9BACL|nr:DMT family transporter [Cohnella lubricantis]MBB6679093.1 DMT family transporter [Cohnella lubricantis]MBP2119665.1 drug/metabolite transporter (DMT)-like permease [Cohnella lubricantis]